jgi:AcrR family transcriptional regulator
MAKQETRKNILKAAEELFSKNGYDGVPTKIIANEAGVTEMTLFNHFQNKELLYKTVVKERYLAVEIQSVFSELTYQDLEKDLKRISIKLIENFMDNKNILMMRLKEKENFQNDESFRIEQDPLVEQITPVFKSYEKKGLINGSGESVALLFMSAVKGLFYIFLLDDKSEEEIKVKISDFVSTMCNGIICR